MADEFQVSILKQGAEVWDKWRKDNPESKIDLRGLDLRDLRGLDLRNESLGKSFKASEARYVNSYYLSGGDFVPYYSASYQHCDFSYADLRDAKLSGIDFSFSNFKRANLTSADLHHSNFYKSDLSYTILHEANLIDAYLADANFSWVRADRMVAGSSFFINVNFEMTCITRGSLGLARFNGADLTRAKFLSCTLASSDFKNCILNGTSFHGSDLTQCDFSGTILKKASLNLCTLIKTNFTDTDLSGSKIYGISVWDLVVNDSTKMNDLIITKDEDPVITVDDIEVAQFIYLLLNNAKVRNVINTITSKSVLILGRFTPERKQILDKLRESLRNRNYLPIIFDFDKPDHKDLTETVAILAQLSCFVIADITDAKSIPQELQKIIPDNPSLPVQPIICKTDNYYSMFGNLLMHASVLLPYEYEGQQELLANIDDKIIEPALKKITEIEEKRMFIEKMIESK